MRAVVLVVAMGILVDWVVLTGDTFALGNNPRMLLDWSSSDLVHMQQSLPFLKKTD